MNEMSVIMTNCKCEWCCNHGKCLMFSEEDRRVNCEDIEADFCPNKANTITDKNI